MNLYEAFYCILHSKFKYIFIFHVVMIICKVIFLMSLLLIFLLQKSMRFENHYFEFFFFYENTNIWTFKNINFHRNFIQTATKRIK